MASVESRVLDCKMMFTKIGWLAARLIPQIKFSVRFLMGKVFLSTLNLPSFRTREKTSDVNYLMISLRRL